MGAEIGSLFGLKPARQIQSDPHDPNAYYRDNARASRPSQSGMPSPFGFDPFSMLMGGVGPFGGGQQQGGYGMQGGGGQMGGGYPYGIQPPRGMQGGGGGQMQQQSQDPLGGLFSMLGGL